MIKFITVTSISIDLQNSQCPLTVLSEQVTAWEHGTTFNVSLQPTNIIRPYQSKYELKLRKRVRAFSDTSQVEVKTKNRSSNGFGPVDKVILYHMMTVRPHHTRTLTLQQGLHFKELETTAQLPTKTPLWKRCCQGTPEFTLTLHVASNWVTVYWSISIRTNWYNGMVALAHYWYCKIGSIII